MLSTDRDMMVEEKLRGIMGIMSDDVERTGAQITESELANTIYAFAVVIADAVAEHHKHNISSLHFIFFLFSTDLSVEEVEDGAQNPQLFSQGELKPILICILVDDIRPQTPTNCKNLPCFSTHTAECGAPACGFSLASPMPHSSTTILLRQSVQLPTEDGVLPSSFRSMRKTDSLSSPSRQWISSNSSTDIMPQHPLRPIRTRPPIRIRIRPRITTLLHNAPTCRQYRPRNTSNRLLPPRILVYGTCPSRRHRRHAQVSGIQSRSVGMVGTIARDKCTSHDYTCATQQDVIVHMCGSGCCSSCTRMITKISH